MAVLIPLCLTDINRLQDELVASSTFPSTDEDTIVRLINSTSAMIARELKRPFKYYSATEYHDGMSSEFLNVDNFPIVSITSIHDDTNRDYDSATLLDSDDYEIYNAEGGVVRYLEGTFANSKSNVKIVHVAGFSEFKVMTGANDQIDFNEGNGDLTATIDPDNYNAADLATEIATQLDATSLASGEGNTYTVSYSATMHKFTITTDGGTLSLLWSSASNDRSVEFGKLIGFIISADDTGATSYVADYPALGIPEDLIDACSALVRWRFEEMRERRSGKFSESRGEQSFSFDYSNVPVYIKEILNPYRIHRV